MNLETIASDIIRGERIAPDTAAELRDAELYGLLYHANRLRAHFKGNTVHLCSIINAKSGVCSENCGFCAQSGHHKTEAAVYPMVEPAQVTAAFESAKRAGARCFGVVTSGRALSDGELENVCSFLSSADRGGVRISASLGELDMKSLKRLKASGLQRFHHNIETARSFFPSVCTTHDYDDRVATVRRAKEAGLEVCCGGILGLGESWQQRIEFAFALRDLDVDSVPLNFLNPVPGTPLAVSARLSPQEILRIIAVFRFILPDKDISVCGGREVNLRDLQSWIFYAGASGMMTGGYLTTPGRAPGQDRQMINDLGLDVADGK